MLNKTVATEGDKLIRMITQEMAEAEWKLLISDEATRAAFVRSLTAVAFGVEQSIEMAKLAGVGPLPKGTENVKDACQLIIAAVVRTAASVTALEAIVTSQTKKGQ